MESVIYLALFLAFLLAMFYLGAGFSFLVVLVFYSVFWWFPIFLYSILSGALFKKENFDMATPYMLIDMTFKKELDSPKLRGIVAVLYSVITFIASVPFLKDGGWLKYFGFFFLFLGLMMFVGFLLAISRKDKRNGL